MYLVLKFIRQKINLKMLNFIIYFMNKKYVLVVDSGVGGLWTLKEIKRILPNENYVYFMDVLNAPYGNKSKAKLLKITDINFKKLFRIFDIKAVVLACNTLSSTCYEYLQQKYYNIPFIKIEPYFEPQLFIGEPTLLLATKSTLKNNKKILEYKSSKNFYFKGFGNIAKKIDDCNGQYDLLGFYLYKKLKKFKKKNIKNIILGCTHFNYIKNQISCVFDFNIEFFENSVSVANQLFNVLKYSGKKSKCKKMGETIIVKKIKNDKKI